MKRQVVAVLSAITGWSALTLALVYFANGLTRPDATVPVEITTDGVAVQPNPVGGVLELVEQTGTFHYTGLSTVTERIPSRLGLCLTLVLVGVIALMIASMARRAQNALDVAFRPSRASWTLGICLAALGAVPGAAHWVEAASILQAAGAPDGLSPRGELSAGWLAAGVIYLTAVSAFGRMRMRASVPSQAPDPAHMAI